MANMDKHGQGGGMQSSFGKGGGKKSMPNPVGQGGGFQNPMMQGYVEQSKKMFDTMQEQMAKHTEQMLGAFGIKR